MAQRDVMKTVQEHYDILIGKGYDVVFVGHYGSFNYGLEYEGSDVDTKAIVVPSFEDIVMNKKPASMTIETETNEHIDVKDIRLMHKEFLKCNMNFVELIFTPYKVVNPKYAKVYDRVFREAETIARYNILQTVRSMRGMSSEKVKALCHPYPSLIHKIEKYGYDGKQLSHIIRINVFVKDFMDGKAYAKCMIPSEYKNLMIGTKSYDIKFSVDEAKDLAETFDSQTGSIYTHLKETTQDVGSSYVEELLNEVIMKVFKVAFKEGI